MSEIRYSEQHEWVRVDGDIVTIGISKFAAEQLGDVVYVELPEVGKKVGKGAEVAVVESVKAASDVFAPLSGEVVAVNAEVEKTPGIINEDALGRGWLFRVRIADPGEVTALMDETAYAAYLETQA